MTHPKRIRRRRVAFGAAGVAAIGALVTLVVGGSGGGAAPGVTAAGVDLGQPTSAARAALIARGREISQRLVNVRLDGSLIAVVRPSDLGARPLVDRALKRARERSPGRIGRSMRWITRRGPVRIPLAAHFRSGALDQWVTEVSAKVDREPVDARLVVRSTTLSVAPSRDGLEVRQGRLRAILASDLAGLPKEIDVPVQRTRPAVTSAQLERAASAAQGIVERPATVIVAGVERRLGPTVVARAIRTDGSRAFVDAAALRPALSQLFRPLERKAVPARFDTDGTIARIVPSKAGLEVDADAVARGLGGDVRPVPGSLVQRPPTFSTAAARRLGIRERIGGYTTPFKPGQPRVVNIMKAAAILDGTIIGPNETISLNEILGQRTADRGFVAAPMIVGNLEVLSTGGGISQVATNLYNAAFEGGLEIVRHTPHALFISRYPAGRDATISWKEPDLVIRNDWPASVLIRTATSPDAITTNLYSRKLGRRVESTTSDPFDQTDPPTRKIINDELKGDEELEIQPGGQGFSVTVTRKVYRGETLARDERRTTVYAPDAHLIAVAPGTPDAERLPEAPAES